MTVTAIPALADGRPADAAPSRSVLVIAEHVTVGAALLWWAFGLTHATGGRDRWVLSIGIVLAVLALGTVRAWRVCSPRSLMVAAAVGLAPALVCSLDTTHWFGGSQAATYAYSAVLFVTVRAYAATPNRRNAALAVVLFAAVAQMAWSMIPWVGSGDPSSQMVGTFYWHNQFAAFLLAPAVIGAGLAAAGASSLRVPGALAAVLGSAGIVYSTSRATMGLLGLGWCAAAVLAVGSRSGMRARLAAGGRWAAIAATTALVIITLPGPPLFSHRVSALASTATRGAQESAAQNGGDRLVFWKQAMSVFDHHVLTGAGFASFGREAGRLDPRGVHSTLVHSGFLQPLSDGGLLLAVPFLVASLALGLGLVRRLRPQLWSAEAGTVALVAAGALLLAAHSAMDFDWTYPSLMALSAVLCAIALAWRPASVQQPQHTATATSMTAVSVLAVAALVLAVPAVKGGWHLNAPASASPVPGEPVS